MKINSLENTPANSPVSILVIDDNLSNRELLTHRLSKESYHTCAAGSAEEAFSIMDIQKFDCILLDLNMPGMDGFEFLMRVKSNPVTEHIPVLVVTGIKDRDAVLTCLDYGAADYLLKPYDFKKINSRVWQCLKDKKQFDWSNSGEMTKNDNYNILIIDDNDLNYEILSMRLKKLGFRSDYASNSQDGIQRLKVKPIDLLFLDIMMPNIDGIETLKQIREYPPFNDLYIVMISSIDNEEVIQQCLDLGAEDYITKPFHPGLLKNTLKRIILNDKQSK